MLFKGEQAFEGAQRASGEGVEAGMIVCARSPQTTTPSHLLSEHRSRRSWQHPG